MPQQPSNGWTPVEENAAAPQGWTPVNEPNTTSGLGLDHLKAVGGKMWDALPDVSSLKMAGQLYKHFTGQPNEVEQLPDKLVTQGLPIMMGMGAPEAEAGSTPAPRPTPQAAESGQPSGILSRTLDVAKRRAGNLPGVKAVKDLNYIVRGAPAEAPVPPAPPTASVPDFWGRGKYGSPVDQWGERIPQFPGAPLPATPAPEQLNPSLVSPSRTTPGQLAAEMTRPQPRASAAPIPPRSGLALPSAPQGAELADLPAQTAKPAAQSGEALGRQPKPAQAGQLAAAMKPDPSEVPPGFQRRALQKLLDDSVGAKRLDPKVPLRQQMPATKPMPTEAPADVPEGHTPVQSSALKSFKYDPAAREFHAKATSGNTVYVYGDVAPEEADAFSKAESKGKAWQSIRQNPLVAKIVDGKRISVKAANPAP